MKKLLTKFMFFNDFEKLSRLFYEINIHSSCSRNMYICKVFSASYLILIYLDKGLRKIEHFIYVFIW